MTVMNESIAIEKTAKFTISIKAPTISIIIRAGRSAKPIEALAPEASARALV
jgi:hypothetical protein